MFDYDNFEEEIDGYIYFYKNNKIIAVYNPFVGLCVNKENIENFIQSIKEDLTQKKKTNVKDTKRTVQNGQEKILL